MKYWTTKEFSKLVGTTVRTLHFYDEIGLLKPHHKQSNGYRFYSLENLKDIQKIDVLKYVGFDLKQINMILVSKKMDFVSSLNLQAKIVNDQITNLKRGLRLIEHSLNSYSKHSDNEIDWQSLTKILEVFKMTNNSVVKEWAERNFSEDERSFFEQISFQTKKVDYELLWIELYKEAKAMISQDPASNQVQALAKKWMDSANNQYDTKPHLGFKMWQLMKSGDVPAGLIQGYDQEVVVFMDKAFEIMRVNKN